MAVYERRYRGYDGPLTPTWERFLVIPRYAFGEVFKSRIFTGFFVTAMIYPLLAMFAIYLNHNLGVFNALTGNDFSGATLFQIDSSSFLRFLQVQGFGFGFVMTMIVAPALISSDQRNNALPLYFSRPFSRGEYILGKLSILAALLSVITWIPGLMLFGLEAHLAKGSWGIDNISIAVSLVVGAWLWILVLSLIALAVSAWVKWKPLASGIFVGLFLVALGFGQMLNALMGTQWGDLIGLPLLMSSVWNALFSIEVTGGTPATVAGFELLLLCVLSLLALERKVRAYEVHR